ncbi:uncharacterized protein LOC124209707 [Daphnia pulex]|uniref:uncharacterized protein LOC124209707 n=1 Tax=Daphnia pulex TaxID=6669 RepID=UPI001EDE5DE3|nr:uncharacterized protein LOC124209707 [Daphnia pulex]
MRFIIVDNRKFLPRDCRLTTVLGILKETAVLGRTTSWTHFGMAIVGENMFTNVLSLQDMKHISLPGFNKAFDDAIKIINNNNAGFGSNLIEKKQKLLSNICSALQNTIKQFKELKEKKEKELLITIIAVHWEGKVEQEIDEFFHSSRDASNVQIQVLEIGNKNFLKDSVVSEKVRVHSLPIKGLDISMEAICKGWAKRRPFDLKFSFPNNGPEVVAKVEDLFVDLRPSQTDLPQSLTITAVTYPMDLCRSYAYGRCVLLSSDTNTSANSYRWEALCKLAKNKETLLIAKEINTFATYALIPCDDLRMLMQPIACVELLLPKPEPNTTELISEDFEQLTKKIQSTDEYGFGPNANIIALLKGEWMKNFTSPQHEPNSKIKGNQPTKKPKNNSAQMTNTKTRFLAHPALGMYSSK